MLRLIGYEWKKLAGKRSVLVLLALFTLINMVKIAVVFGSNSYLYEGAAGRSGWHTIYWQLYEDYRGEITEERVSSLLETFRPIEAQTADQTASTRLDDPDTMTGNIYGDYNLLRKYFIQPMEAYCSYGQKAELAARSARKNATFYRDCGNLYEARKNAWIYHHFKDRQIGSFEYMEMVNYYVHYDFSSALILLLGLFAMSGVFVREKESDMEAMLLTSPAGGRKTTAAKIAAAGLFLTGISLWFSLVDIAGFGLVSGTLEGYGMPLFAIPNFAAGPLTVTVGQYAVLSALARALGIWAAGMLFLLMARFGKNALQPFLWGFLACLGMVVLGTGRVGSGHIWRKVLNPFSLVQNRMVFGRTEFVNAAGFPVPGYLAAVLAAVLTGTVLAMAVFLLTDRNKLRRKRRAGT